MKRTLLMFILAVVVNVSAPAGTPAAFGLRNRALQHDFIRAAYPEQFSRAEHNTR